MLVKSEYQKRSKEEKERILLDAERLGVVASCRKHGISVSVYYAWLEKYKTSGLAGLDPKQGRGEKKEMERLRKELQIAKELIAEKELQIKLQEELLKKRIAQWKKGDKS